MKKILEEIKNGIESKGLFGILFAIGVFIVAILIFSAGVTVGFRKASFARAWGEHYNENFGIGRPGENPRVSGMRNPFATGYFPNAHGAVGKIIKIELPNIIVQDKDHTEKVIAISADTKIEEGRIDIRAEQLKAGDFLVTIGTPNEKGIIDAKFIRIIPSPEFFQ